jgi:hypothetical protein
VIRKSDFRMCLSMPLEWSSHTIKIRDYVMQLINATNRVMYETFHSNTHRIPLILKLICQREDGQTDGRTDMTKLSVTFLNFANAPKNACTSHLEFKTRTSASRFDAKFLCMCFFIIFTCSEFGTRFSSWGVSHQ